MGHFILKPISIAVTINAPGLVPLIIGMNEQWKEQHFRIFDFKIVENCAVVSLELRMNNSTSDGNQISLDHMLDQCYGIVPPDSNFEKLHVCSPIWESTLVRIINSNPKITDFCLCTMNINFLESEISCNTTNDSNLIRHKILLSANISHFSRIGTMMHMSGLSIM